MCSRDRDITFQVNVPKSAGVPEQRLVTVTHPCTTTVLALKETLVAMAGETTASPAQLDLTVTRTRMLLEDDAVTLDEAGVREGDRLRLYRMYA